MRNRHETAWARKANVSQQMKLLAKDRVSVPRKHRVLPAKRNVGLLEVQRLVNLGKVSVEGGKEAHKVRNVVHTTHLANQSEICKLEIKHYSYRMLCMASCGAPMSTVRMPVSPAVIGPIVEPHGESLRTTNGYVMSVWNIRS